MEFASQVAESCRFVLGIGFDPMMVCSLLPADDTKTVSPYWLAVAVTVMGAISTVVAIFSNIQQARRHQAEIEKLERERAGTSSADNAESLKHRVAVFTTTYGRHQYWIIFSILLVLSGSLWGASFAVRNADAQARLQVREQQMHEQQDLLTTLRAEEQRNTDERLRSTQEIESLRAQLAIVQSTINRQAQELEQARLAMSAAASPLHPVLDEGRATVFIDSFWRSSCGEAPSTYEVLLRVREGVSDWVSTRTGARNWDADFANDRNTGDNPGASVFSLSTPPVVLSEHGDLQVVVQSIQRGRVGERTSGEAAFTLTSSSLRRQIASAPCRNREFECVVSVANTFDISAPERYCQLYCKVRLRIEGTCKQ